LSSDELTAGGSTKSYKSHNNSQLRLHHLFALTAVMAILLAIQGPQRSPTESQSARQNVPVAIWLVWGIVYQVFEAAAITVLAYGIADYRRGLPFFHQPGHWILVEVSVAVLLGIPVSLIFRSVDITQMRIGTWNMVLMLLFSLYSLLSLGLGRLIINMYFARKCLEQRWKRVFYGKAFAALFFGFADFLVVATTLAAARTDRCPHSQRDQSHWWGVVVQLALSSLTIVNVAIWILTFVLL
jgi:hypothetical protein